MAGTTAAYGFPYPTSTDNVSDGASKIQALAQAIEDFIDGSSSPGTLFNYSIFEDTNPRTTTNCSSTPKNVASSTATGTFTIGKSGLFAVIVSGNANNTSTAANGWALGCEVKISTTAYGDVELSNDPSGTGRNGGASYKLYDLTAGSTITLTPRVRTILAGGTDSIVVYQHKIQVISLG